MVLKIILLSLFFILTILIISFLFIFLLPLIQKKTNNEQHIIFSKMEKEYVVPKEDEVTCSSLRAVVLCCPDKEFTCHQNFYNKELSCVLINSLHESSNDCKFSCIGHGDCAQSCPQSAIIMKNKTAVVTNLCIGCGRCINVCPKKIIKMVSKDDNSIVMCSSNEDALTTCSAKCNEQKLERKEKKYFKIWEVCYKLIRS